MPQRIKKEEQEPDLREEICEVHNWNHDKKVEEDLEILYTKHFNNMEDQPVYEKKTINQIKDFSVNVPTSSIHPFSDKIL